MRSVKSLIEELQKFPPHYKCWVDEGEDCGLNVYETRDMFEAKGGWIRCGSDDDNDDMVAVNIHEPSNFFKEDPEEDIPWEEFRRKAIED